ncbi:MAG TPA: hypothetical protein VKF60_13725, partial [Myxococcota bacterium]|nr:hypothetical protein [Myxococcota bacterium]
MASEPCGRSDVDVPATECASAVASPDACDSALASLAPPTSRPSNPAGAFPPLACALAVAVPPSFCALLLAVAR